MKSVNGDLILMETLVELTVSSISSTLKGDYELSEISCLSLDGLY